ncbi:MAG: hypothetical protein J6T74_09645 [Clostridia bacterium]|nr:hypothetical protein [Clostridia bacterium]
MEKKVLKLHSLNPQEYPDIEIECIAIEDMRAFTEQYISQLGLKGVYPKSAQKTASVFARLGIIGEEVDTRPRVERDGKIYVIGETKGKVKIAGSMIVTNPDGEEYIVKPEMFAKKYKPTSKEGVYEPISCPIKYIITEKDIAFKASWGEDMFAVKDAALNVTDLDEVYAIQNDAFKKTYTTIDEKENTTEK